MKYKFLANSKGSLTLEASIIIPTIMLILISLAFFSMYVYHRVVLLDTAVYAATQTANNWDNSYKDLETSQNYSYKNDDLYWRITDDFNGSELTLNKIGKTNRYIENQLKYEVFSVQKTDRNQQVSYKNEFFLARTVVVNIKQNIIMPVDWLGNYLATDVTADAKADVVEPVEFIRNIDLAAKLLNAIKKDETEQNDKTKTVYYSVLRGVYHYPGCRYIKNIKSENLIVAASENDAIKSGRRLCEICARKKR